MKVKRTYTITSKLLKEYYQAAFQNAQALISDAKTLLENQRIPRSYSLACLSIEETGKGFQAWDGLGRNLNNPAVQTTLRKIFEDHSKKNISGLISILVLSQNKDKESYEAIADVSSQLIEGREASMYVDVTDRGKITIPQKIVREKNAKDTIELATSALAVTKHYVSSNEPRSFSNIDDNYFEISNKRSHFDMLNNVDFWNYYMDEIKKNPTKGIDLKEPTVKYYEQYYSQKKKYTRK